jgi:hypothetical protein
MDAGVEYHRKVGRFVVGGVVDWKSFISGNKDTFEVVFAVAGTISAILLGFMAVILSHRANKISDAQTELLKRQTLLAEEQLQPKFRLRRQTCSRGDELFDCVEVWNDGSKLSNFWIRQFSFLEISRYTEDGYQIRWWPGYYLFDRSYTGETAGLLVTLSAMTSRPVQGINLSSHIQTLEDRLRTHWPGLQSLTPRIFLQINYIDLLGASHQVVYEVRANPSHEEPGFAHRLSTDEAKRIPDLFGPEPVSDADFAVLTADTIIAKWETLTLRDPENVLKHAK